MPKMNRFDQLVEDLKDGKLGLTHIQIAIRAWLRDRDDLPDGVKDLLAGKHESMSGLVYKQFKIIQETIGTVETAFGRGYRSRDFVDNPVETGRVKRGQPAHTGRFDTRAELEAHVEYMVFEEGHTMTFTAQECRVAYSVVQYIVRKIKARRQKERTG